MAWEDHTYNLKQDYNVVEKRSVRIFSWFLIASYGLILSLVKTLNFLLSCLVS